MLEQRIQQHFIDSADLKYQAGPLLSKSIAQAVQALQACVTSGGKVLACGTGVSGQLAAQFVAHFVGRFERERPELGAIALQADGTHGLDENLDAADRERFARWVCALGQMGDVLLVFSVTGDAPAVLAAIEAAHEREMTVLALTGGIGGALGRLLRETDVHVCVPHERPVRVLETHLLTLHCLCDGVDLLLLGDPEGEGVG